VTLSKKENKILADLKASKKARRSALARLPLKVKIRQLIELQKIDWATKPKGRKPRFRPWLEP
jgi:hypothetical protein